MVNVQGAKFTVYPITDKHYRTCYPMHPAYAVNVSQMQKKTLDHMTMWLDTEHAPAAIYIALSRVRRKHDIVYSESVATHHIRPSWYV